MRNPTPYFQQYTYEPQQTVIEDLIEQSIASRGLVVYYMPRTVVDRDIEFGDDILSEFKDAIEIEALPRDVDQWGGQGDTLTKWGINIPDQMTLTVSRRKWESWSKPVLRTTEGGTILLEECAPWTGDKSGCVWLEDANVDAASLGRMPKDRPLEGDFIYIPVFRKLFKVTFVEHERLFYEFGKLMTYDLKVELADYNSEKITTGVTELDHIEAAFSLDQLDDHVLLENGGALLLEEGELLILEQSTQPEDVTSFAENRALDADGNDSVTFISGTHPFTRGRRSI